MAGSRHHEGFMGRRRSSSGEKRKNYKVVMEAVTEEKKKLRLLVSYSVEAPSGFTFVPIGAPKLTDFCKERSRKRGFDAYVVSAPPKNKAHHNPANISHHIHRVGFHFENSVVEQGVDWLGYNSSRRGRYRADASRLLGPSGIEQRLQNHGRRLGMDGKGASAQQKTEQIAATIKELFSKIPEKDVMDIVERAFEEGANTVGNATELSLSRKVQLAVVAHIRHVYTDYDKLLKIFGWQKARQMVEELCLDQLVKWRGENEDESHSHETEDIFREVIIIDDDEDDEQSGSMDVENFDDDSSVEFIDEHRPATSHGSPQERPPKKFAASPSPQIIRSIPSKIDSVRPVRGARPLEVSRLDEISRSSDYSQMLEGSPRSTNRPLPVPAHVQNAQLAGNSPIYVDSPMHFENHRDRGYTLNSGSNRNSPIYISSPRTRESPRSKYDYVHAIEDSPMYVDGGMDYDRRPMPLHHPAAGRADEHHDPSLRRNDGSYGVTQHVDEEMYVLPNRRFSGERYAQPRHGHYRENEMQDPQYSRPVPARTMPFHTPTHQYLPVHQSRAPAWEIPPPPAPPPPQYQSPRRKVVEIIDDPQDEVYPSIEYPGHHGYPMKRKYGNR